MQRLSGSCSEDPLPAPLGPQRRASFPAKNEPVPALAAHKTGGPGRGTSRTTACGQKHTVPAQDARHPERPTEEVVEQPGAQPPPPPKVPSLQSARGPAPARTHTRSTVQSVAGSSQARGVKPPPLERGPEKAESSQSFDQKTCWVEMSQRDLDTIRLTSVCGKYGPRGGSGWGSHLQSQACTTEKEHPQTPPPPGRAGRLL